MTLLIKQEGEWSEHEVENFKETITSNLTTLPTMPVLIKIDGHWAEWEVEELVEL